MGEIKMDEEPKVFKGWPSLLPLLYLVVIAAIAGAFHYLGVPPEMTALIVGAGLTRVKISSK